MRRGLDGAVSRAWRLEPQPQRERARRAHTGALPRRMHRAGGRGVHRAEDARSVRGWRRGRFGRTLRRGTAQRRRGRRTRRPGDGEGRWKEEIGRPRQVGVRLLLPGRDRQGGVPGEPLHQARRRQRSAARIRRNGADGATTSRSRGSSGCRTACRASRRHRARGGRS